jgi:threonine dehydratase
LKEEIKNAKKLIAKYIKQLPLYYSNYFSEIFEGDIYFKLENLQRTGSFKIRGALSSIINNMDKCKNGVVAASAGNHAQGVAFGSSLFGIKATIVMPKQTPLVKVENTKSYGAEVILHGNNYDEAYSYALNLSKQKHFYFIHPFNDMDVIAGQGTIGLEILDEDIDIDQIIIPIGGGGLIAGIASYVKEVRPDIKIIGVQSENAAGMYYSFLRKSLVTLSSSATIAEGIAVKKVGDLTYGICSKYVDEIVTVSENEIAFAILQYIEKSKLVVEGAGAVPLAAVLANKIDVKGKTSALVVSGGNIDVNLISRVINKGLVTTGRFAQISIILKDTPGSLSAATDIIAKCGANVLDIKHYRFDINLPVNFTKVVFDIETKGREHSQEILNELYRHGYEAMVNG